MIFLIWFLSPPFSFFCKAVLPSSTSRKYPITHLLPQPHPLYPPGPPCSLCRACAHRQGWSHPPPTTARFIHPPLTHNRFTALLQADSCGTDTGSTAAVFARPFSPLSSIKKEQSQRVGLPGVSASRPLVRQDWADPALLARAAAPRAVSRVAGSAELLTRPREVPSGPQRMSAVAPRRKLPNVPFPGEAVGRKQHTLL